MSTVVPDADGNRQLNIYKSGKKIIAYSLSSRFKI